MTIQQGAESALCRQPTQNLHFNTITGTHQVHDVSNGSPRSVSNAGRWPDLPRPIRLVGYLPETCIRIRFYHGAPRGESRKPRRGRRRTEQPRGRRVGRRRTTSSPPTSVERRDHPDHGGPPREIHRGSQATRSPARAQRRLALHDRRPTLDRERRTPERRGAANATPLIYRGGESPHGGAQAHHRLEADTVPRIPRRTTNPTNPQPGHDRYTAGRKPTDATDRKPPQEQRQRRGFSSNRRAAAPPQRGSTLRREQLLEHPPPGIDDTKPQQHAEMNRRDLGKVRGPRREPRMRGRAPRETTAG